MTIIISQIIINISQIVPHKLTSLVLPQHTSNSESLEERKRGQMK